MEVKIKNEGIFIYILASIALKILHPELSSAWCVAGGAALSILLPVLDGVAQSLKKKPNSFDSLEPIRYSIVNKYKEDKQDEIRTNSDILDSVSGSASNIPRDK